MSANENQLPLEESVINIDLSGMEEEGTATIGLQESKGSELISGNDLCEK